MKKWDSLIPISSVRIVNNVWNVSNDSDVSKVSIVNRVWYAKKNVQCKSKQDEH